MPRLHSWVGGIFLLLPALGIISLVAGLYSLFLLYLGLPVLMKSPSDRAMGYTVVTIIVAVVLFVVLNRAAMDGDGRSGRIWRVRPLGAGAPANNAGARR